METHFLDLDMKVPILCNKSSLVASFIAEVTFYKLLQGKVYIATATPLSIVWKKIGPFVPL